MTLERMAIYRGKLSFHISRAKNDHMCNSVIGNDKKLFFHSYGTANQAFDPHSELDDISHGSFQVRCIVTDIPQCIRMVLNKRSGPKQKTITASKGTP